MTRSSAPMVIVIGGPNGAGKSTSAERILRGPLAVDEFVNADTIAQGLSAYRPETVAVAAGRLMLARLRALAGSGTDFAFETTLSGVGHARFLAGLRRGGHRIHLTFLSLPSADLAVARVAERVRRGGHHVDDDVVRRRFKAGLRNLFAYYLPLVDTWHVYDNRDLERPRLVAARSSGAGLVIEDPTKWEALEEIAR